MVKRLIATAIASFWLGVTLTGLWAGCSHTTQVGPKAIELAAGDCVVLAELHQQADAGSDWATVGQVCATVEELTPFVTEILHMRRCAQRSCD